MLYISQAIKYLQRMLVQAQNQKMQTEFKKPYIPKQKKKPRNVIVNSEEDKKAMPEESNIKTTESNTSKNNDPSDSVQKDQENIASISKESASSQGENQDNVKDNNNSSAEKVDLAVVKIENDSDCTMEVSGEQKADENKEETGKVSEVTRSNEASDAGDQLKPSEEKEIKIKEEKDESTASINESDDKSTDGVADDNDCVADDEEEDEEEEEDEDLARLANSDKNIDIDPKTYCKLGHFHLLLEDYPKGNFSSILRLSLFSELNADGN